MCVIIHKLPGKEIPFHQLRSAASVNKDGFGIAIIDRGKLEIIRDFDEKGNDPDKFAKIIQDAKDHHVFAHTRYATAGTKDLENVHPFQVLEPDDIYPHQIWLMHNGTMWSHKSNNHKDKESDTHNFSNRIIKPTLERLKLISAYHNENVLDDPLLHAILETHGSHGNFFLLFDETGHSYTYRENQGEEWEWGWSSNKYSMERFANPQKATTTPVTSTASAVQQERGSSQEAARFHHTPGSKGPIAGYSSSSISEGWDSRPHVTKGSTFTDHSQTVFQQHMEKLEAESGVDSCGIPLPHVEKKVPKPAKRKVQYVEEQMRKSFIEVAGLDNIEDAFDMTPEQVKELVLDFPNYATIFIQDLIVYAVELIEENDIQNTEEATDVEVTPSESNLLQ